MPWALASSAYVIYLYRKLNAVDEPQRPDAGTVTSVFEAEVAKLDEKIGRLEGQLHGRPSQ